MQTLLRAGLGLALFAAPAASQLGQLGDYGQFGHAGATLYTKAEDDVLLAAIEIEIDAGWYLYDADKGPGTGSSTKIELGGDGLDWGTPRWPESHRHEIPALGDEPATYTNIHEGSITIFAAARMDDPESAANATLSIRGQTCESGPRGTCVAYTEKGLTTEGEGATGLWADFPRDIVPAAGDVIESGRADATLFTRVRYDKVVAALTIEIDAGWHLYHTELGGTEYALPLSIDVAADHVAWGAPKLPQPERLDLFDDEWVWSHHGTITAYVEGDVEPGKLPGPVTATLKGQTCSEGAGAVCVDYEERVFDRGEGDDAVFAGAGGEFATTTPGAEEAGPEDEKTGLGAFLGLAIFWGLFTLLMPCTYPMIPITISFFTKQASARGGKVLSLALLYGAGIVLVFILIGVVVGSAIVPFATHPITNLVIGAFFVLFALSLFGVINLQPPSAVMNLAGKASMTGGYLGVFLMGTTLVVTSFTCTAPFVGSLLSVGAADGDLLRIILGMGTFGLTMAIPFVALSLLPGKIATMPRSGQWMNTLKVTLGFIELAAAFKFLSNTDLSWEWHVISRELFLLIWAVIFAVTAAYLLVFAEGKRASFVGGRALAGATMLLLSLYFLWGMRGNDMDRVMTAILPNYSGGKLMPEWWTSGARHAIVVDDYDQAVEIARAENKLLLVNFTGITCVNCRLMEENVFPADGVAELLEDNFVEARLHTDGATNLDRILQLQHDLTQSIANPYYVLQRPGASDTLGKTAGYSAPDTFKEFLNGALRQRAAAIE